MIVEARPGHVKQVLGENWLTKHFCRRKGIAYESRDTSRLRQAIGSYEKICRLFFKGAPLRFVGVCDNCQCILIPVNHGLNRLALEAIRRSCEPDAISFGQVTLKPGKNKLQYQFLPA
jgi:hypothetical protein